MSRDAIRLCVLAVLLVLGHAASVMASPWCHQVRAGETLARIARRYHTTVERLRTLNPRAGAARLRPGRLLMLPALGRLHRGRLETPAPLLAPVGSLVGENRAADRDDLSRMRDGGMVRRFVDVGLLVPLPAETATYRIPDVPAALRVARPWTKRFIEQLAAALHGLFGGRAKITSLTRTVARQRILGRTNVNAAPASGAEASTHLTGATFDLSKRPLSSREVAWTRLVLRRLARRRLVHAVEEFRQPHFHVMVRRAYADYGRRLPSPLLIGGC